MYFCGLQHTKDRTRRVAVNTSDASHSRTVRGRKRIARQAQRTIGSNAATLSTNKVACIVFGMHKDKEHEFVRACERACSVPHGHERAPGRLVSLRRARLRTSPRATILVLVTVYVVVCKMPKPYSNPLHHLKDKGKGY